MTYAISDIHGCKKALECLLASLPDQEAQLIFLGDYIDRGPDSKGVVELLLSFRQRRNIIHLVGNHEFLLQGATECAAGRTLFLGPIVGGTETLKSYEGEIEDIPEMHWNFLLRDSLSYYETESHIFVHGGVDPDLPMEKQSLETLAWKRFHEAEAHFSGKTVICGHTIIGDSPVLKEGGHTIGIDTGAGKGGWITALEVETGTYFQANEEQLFREGRLG